VLPQAIDKLTLHGRLPTHEELTRAAKSFAAGFSRHSAHQLNGQLDHSGQGDQPGLRPLSGLENFFGLVNSCGEVSRSALIQVKLHHQLSVSGTDLSLCRGRL